MDDHVTPPDPSTEALVARAQRVCDWADLHGDELEYRVRTEEDARIIDDALLAAWDVLALAARLSQAEEALRREWWLNHGHPYSAQYGDDGEMQCQACPADFKRQPLDELRGLVFVARALAASSAGETGE